VKRLIEYPLKDGGSIVAEVDEPEEAGVDHAASSGETIEKSRQNFETMLERIKPTAMAVITTLRDLSESPSEIGVEFGLS
jgi:Trypsin-co-occurring domain 1